MWGKADVSDTLLGQTVLKARRAVGDTGNEQNAIRTVPRFGYRWVAPIQVEAAAEETPAATAETERMAAETAAPAATPSPSAPEVAPPVRQAGAHFRPRIAAFAAFAAALVVLAATGFWWHARRDTTVPATPTTTQTQPTPDAAAVLPVDVDAGGEWTWLRLGLMDLVATRLRNAGQTVVPADNVVALARENGGNGAAHRVREATGARLIVLPSASRSGSEWIVHLLLRADGGDREVEARSTDVIEAGRAAADRLLAVLGKSPAKLAPDAPDASLAERLSRAEAALLTDDLDGARRLLETAPPGAQKAPELRLRLAQIDFRAGQFDHARGLLDALLEEVSEETDPVLRARILNGSGAVAVRQDKNADAERDFGEAIALLENRNQPAALGQAYTGRGIAYAQQARLDLAAADFSRARIALELAGDTLALARVEANEGIVDGKRGRYADALSSHELAAQRFERFGALNELILTLANAAEAQLALLRPADALATSDRGWALLGRLENPNTRHSFQITRVETLAENGRLLEARALLRELLGAIPHDGDPAMLGRVQAVQARTDLLDGQPAAAAALASAALERLSAPDYLRDRAGSLADAGAGPARAGPRRGGGRRGRTSGRLDGHPLARLAAARRGTGGGPGRGRATLGRTPPGRGPRRLREDPAPGRAAGRAGGHRRGGDLLRQQPDHRRRGTARRRGGRPGRPLGRPRLRLRPAAGAAVPRPRPRGRLARRPEAGAGAGRRAQHSGQPDRAAGASGRDPRNPADFPGKSSR